MAITVLSRPSVVCWTRNRITFGFLYSLMNTSWKMHLQVIDNSTSDVFAEVMYPFANTSGVMNIDLEGLLDPIVNYGLPANLTAPSEFTLGKRPVRLRWRTYDTVTNTYGSWTTDSQDHIICKGGIDDLNGYDEFQTNNFSSAFTAAKFFPYSGHQMLTWQPSGHLITPSEYGWLLYFSSIADNDQQLLYIVTYQDGTTATLSTNLPGYGSGSFLYKWFHIPVGIDQCSLDPTGKGVRNYTVRVRRFTGGTILSSYDLKVDNRPFYDTLTVHYINSIAGTDTIKFRGGVEFSASAEKKEYEQKISSTNISQLGKNPYYDSKMRISWKANTGYITDQLAASLMDLLNSQFMFMLYNNKWLALRIKNKDAIYRKTQDKKNNLTIEFETAATFRNLPRQIMNL